MITYICRSCHGAGVRPPGCPDSSCPYDLTPRACEVCGERGDGRVGLVLACGGLRSHARAVAARRDAVADLRALAVELDELRPHN